jgi:ABC-type uncharacterized transport system involved in gliding motility auxiliary subunit
MRRSSALTGIIGLVLITFGLLDYFIATGFRFFVFVNLVLGVFALVLWLVSSREAVGSIVGSRTTRYGANAVIYSILFIGVLVAINYLGTLHHRRLDLTEDRAFSLSSQSIVVAKNLEKPLKLYGFFEGGEDQRARGLYESYAYASPKITFELVDPDKHPELAEKYKISVMGTTHIQYDGDKGDGTNITELSEENITNGIIKVTKGGKKIVYFLTGEGEGDPDDTEHPEGMGSLRQALEGESFEVRKLSLATQPSVPADCNILIVAGPQKPLTQHVLDQIDAYLKGGGRAVVTLQAPRLDDPKAEAGLVKLMDGWGVNIGNDIVVDQVLRLFAGPALGLSPIVTTYGDHPVTKGFNQRTVFPMTRSVEPLGVNPKPGLAVTAIAKTSDTSWAEVDLEGVFKRQTATFHPGDRRGPITVADAIEADQQFTGKDSHPRLIIYGSTEFADNQYVNSYNRDLFMNSVDWLAGEEKAVSIRPHTVRASRMRLTVDQFNVLFALSVLMLPELLLIIGIAVWWERRN